MKFKKTLVLVVVFSFLFISNIILFSTIQKPLYGYWICFTYANCEPMYCRYMAEEECFSTCRNEGSECEDASLVEAYCADGSFGECDCWSAWLLNCENQNSYYYYCHDWEPNCGVEVL